jgi:hypothetical protein
MIADARQGPKMTIATRLAQIVAMSFDARGATA